MQRGRARIVQQQFQEAVNDFERAVQIDRNNR